MLLTMKDLERIVSGEVDRAYRRWTRPTVKAGGTLTTARGVLAIGAVVVVDPEALTADDAERAGFDSLPSLRAALSLRPGGDVYRIDLRYAGADPRRALRADDDLSTADLEGIRTKLRRMDRRSTTGPWTEVVLRIVAAHPEVRAGDLAPRVPLETTAFKRNVRKLKALGLTESLRVGYRLSPRGKAVLTAHQDEGGE
ncbi:MAG: hypothetical protein RLN75_06800 [Longimicrobiales bacterium]